MKTNLLSTIFLICLSSGISAQELISEGLTTAETNAFGDPITNVLDADGAKQGEWIYQDINGFPISKQTYLDHTLLNTQFAVMNSAESVQWLTGVQWQTDLNLKSELELVITNSIGALESDQQLLLLFNSNGELIRIAPLGNWDTDIPDVLGSQIMEYLNNNQITFSNATYILL